ncbi:MAG TPA: hypothetical protein VHC19_09945 [Pirellulales bacterium]|nr:hypothetical protein [Pirellulales bacterium]
MPAVIFAELQPVIASFQSAAWGEHGKLSIGLPLSRMSRSNVPG